VDRKQARAFEGFVNESGDALLRMATLLTADPDAAEDVYQEALHRLAMRWSRVDSPLGRSAVEISRTAATGIEDQTFENPKTGAVLETAFVYQDGTKGTDLYLSVTSRGSLPPNPYRR
jgi:hypothetical protein